MSTFHQHPESRPRQASNKVAAAYLPKAALRLPLSIKDEEIRNTLYYSIKGSGAFRRFKNDIRRFNLEDDWYKYRDVAIKEIAIEWCENNNIQFAE
jgi:hypothetical protein